MFNYNTLISQIIISSKIATYLVFAFCFACLLLCKRIRLQKELLGITLVLIAMIMSSMIVNLDLGNFNGYLIIVMKVLGAFLILHTFEKKLFFSSCASVITIVAIASLVITYVFPIFSLERFLPVVTNRLGVQFYFGLLSFKIKSYGSFSLRNFGLFSEPAVFCFYLFIGALFIMSKEEWSFKDIICMAILALTMITTFSPIGLISSVMIYVILMFRVFSKKKNGSEKFWVLIIAALGIALFFYNADFNKGLDFVLSKSSLSSGSGEGRFNSIIFNLLQGLKAPLFGGGLIAITEQAEVLGFNTSTTGASLLGFGLPFMAFLIYLQIKSICSVLPPRRILLAVIMIVLFFLQINNHGLIQSDWFWIMSLLGVGGFENDESYNYSLQSGNA